MDSSKIIYNYQPNNNLTQNNNQIQRGDSQTGLADLFDKDVIR
jgi:hypothetical protein